MRYLKQIKTNWIECKLYANALNAQRLINLIKISVGYGYSRLFNHPVIWGNPYAISIEPGTACNLHCPECPTGNGTLGRPLGKMNLETFKHIADELPSSIFHLNLFLQGEPLLHPEIDQFVKVASRRKLFITISSNAQLLTPSMAEKLVSSGLSKIIISLDGLTPESYSTYRVGGSLQKVMEGIENINLAKIKQGKQQPITEIQFIAFGHNEHEVSAAQQLINRPGIDRVVIKTAQIYGHNQYQIAPPKNQHLSRYVLQNDQLKMKKQLVNKCFRLWSSMVITWNGDITPCCYDKDATLGMGNIRKHTLPQVWQSDKMQAFRSTILKNKSAINICHNCPEGR